MTLGAKNYVMYLKLLAFTNYLSFQRFHCCAACPQNKWTIMTNQSPHSQHQSMNAISKSKTLHPAHSQMPSFQATWEKEFLGYCTCPLTPIVTWAHRAQATCVAFDMIYFSVTYMPTPGYRVDLPVSRTGNQISRIKATKVEHLHHCKLTSK